MTILLAAGGAIPASASIAPYKIYTIMPLHNSPPHVTPLGDQAVTLSWPEVVDADLPAVLLSARRAIEAAEMVGLRAVVPGFETLSVHYDPRLWRVEDVSSWVREACALAPAVSLNDAPLVEIPVCYDPEFGLDLGDVVAHCRLTIDKMIALHSGAEYTVRMIGFAPGFPYLAGLPRELHMPRLATPRVKVPRGTVAIGGGQTGIYSVESPGGWRLIGRTPVELFDASRERPSLLAAGDRVKFRAISREEFEVPSTSTAGLFKKGTGTRRQELELTTDRTRPRASPLFEQQATVLVLRGGAGMTVQERRRWNWLASGVAVSGAIDSAAQRLANLLVANQADDAVLEVTLAFGELEFLRDALIAVTGGDLVRRLMEIHYHWVGRWPFVRGRGWRLVPPALVAGRTWRSRGGLIRRKCWGAGVRMCGRKWGACRGELLAAGDELPVGEPSELAVRVMQRLACDAAQWFVPLEGLDSIGEPTIRFLRGAQFEWLTTASQLALVTEPFQILPASDRTGLRLRGPSLTFQTQRELASTGVAVGTVQLPASGDPIVLLNDGPPTGGYAQVAHVIGADLPKLAQVRPGEAVRLKEVTMAEVEELRVSQWREEIQQEMGIELALRELV